MVDSRTTLRDSLAMEKESSMLIRLTIDDNEETHQTIKNQSNASLIIEVKDNLNELLESPEIVETKKKSKISIYKIPHFMRKANPAAFEPKLVSFGPYHHGKPHLQPMELEKRKAFKRFKTNNGLTVKLIVENVSSILEELSGSYDKVEEEWTKNPAKFLELMIVDGCFMLEFFNECPTSLRNMSDDIVPDMLLLENQLPMKLLKKLHSLANRPNQQLSKDLIDQICKSMSMAVDKLIVKPCNHILEMYRFSLLHPITDLKGRDDVELNHDEPSSDWQLIPPATRLREAGITFKISNNNSFTNVSFNRGVLSLPKLTVDDDTESALLNVMAYEKLHVEAGSKVTSFMILMNNLIDGESDVRLLASKKIVANALGNDAVAAEMFNRLGTGVGMDLNSYMVGVHKKVNKHYNKPVNQECASLKHKYFQSPWSFIYLCAAILGFLLLILQFVYQILDYYLKV